MADAPPGSDAAFWLAKGDEDLQAVEKFLKACLVAAGDVPPKTHDLDLLFDLLARKGVVLPLDRDMLAGLRLYAIAPRYPGFGDEQSERDLPRLLEFVRAARTAIGAHLRGKDAQGWTIESTGRLKALCERGGGAITPP